MGAMSLTVYDKYEVTFVFQVGIVFCYCMVVTRCCQLPHPLIISTTRSLLQDQIPSKFGLSLISKLKWYKQMQC